MSHIAMYKCSLTQPCLEILRQALETVAKRHEGTVSNRIQGFYRKDDQEVDLAISTPEVKRGLGIILSEDKSMEFIGDPWGCETQMEQLKAEIIRDYQAVAVGIVLKELGYSVQVHEDGSGYLLEGVAA